jgi:hypothetical protein
MICDGAAAQTPCRAGFSSPAPPEYSAGRFCGITAESHTNQGGWRTARHGLLGAIALLPRPDEPRRQLSHVAAGPVPGEPLRAPKAELLASAAILALLGGRQVGQAEPPKRYTRGRRPQPLSARAGYAPLAARACTARGGASKSKWWQRSRVHTTDMRARRNRGCMDVFFVTPSRRVDARWPDRPIGSRAPRRRPASAVARRRAIRARPPPARADAARARRARARTPAPRGAARKHPQRARARRPPAPRASVRDRKRLRPRAGLRAPSEVALRAPRAPRSRMAAVALWGPSRARRAMVRAKSRRAR